MKKIKYLLQISILVLGLSACSTKIEPKTTEPPTIESEIGQNVDLSGEQLKPNPIKENYNPTEDPDVYDNPDIDLKFSLSEDEQKIYDSYIANPDLELLKDLSPISFTKMYLQCGIDGNFQQEFLLYEKESLKGTTFEEYFENNANGKEGDYETRKLVADSLFATIDKAEFIVDDEANGEAHIYTITQLGDDMVLRLKKADNGMWLIKYLYK